MGEYVVGRQRTRVRRQNNVMVNVSLKRPVYDRLCAMRDALQRELGPDQYVTIASIVRRILYQHPALRKLAMRHYSPPEETNSDDIVQ